MDPAEFRRRTKDFAVRVVRLAETLPKQREINLIANQMVRSACSVGANYRAACVAKSRADFVAKMKIVEEECDETLYWLELIVELGKADPTAVRDLYREGRQILGMTVASIKTARARGFAARPVTARGSCANGQSSVFNGQS